MTVTDQSNQAIPEVARGLFDEQPKRLLIGADWVDAADGRTFDTTNPATGERIATVAMAGPEDVERAVRAARMAFASGVWRDAAPADKTRVMLRIADLIEANVEELATTEVLDNGKPISLARRDALIAADTFRYYAGWPTKITGQLLPSSPGKHIYVRREPVGVCGAIVPWNFPMIVTAWKLAPAIACGNASVLKPASETPLTATRLAEIFLDAGLPPGVVNVVQGSGATTGAALVAHHDVDKIGFTGSTEVGKTVMKSAADTMKRLSLELGGKSPNVVFADADLDQAVVSAMMACFANSGQICVAGTRLLLERSIHDEFVERLVNRTRQLRVGSGLDENTQIGPVVTRSQYDIIASYLKLGTEEGADLAVGGSVIEGRGNFVQPTIFTGVTDHMRIAQEEIFGPVLAVIPFDDFNDAIAHGNRTIFGLAAAVWTRDLTKAHRFAAEIKAGTVWVNTYSEVDLGAPFGGYKQSGFGRELGEEGIELFTERKTVHVKL